MVASTSRLAYTDCFDLLEKAITDPKGIKIKFASHDDAYYFRLRLHRARQIDRQENAQIYEPGEPMYGRSVYDAITCRIRNDGNGCWLRLERIDAREFVVESLTEPEKEPQLLDWAKVELPGPPRQEIVGVEPIRPHKFQRRI